MKNTSLSAAMLQAKCPRCRQGDLFPTSVFSYTKLSEINGKCPECEATITPEPDFFYGAMYISYAFSVALMVNVSILVTYFFDRPDTMVYVWTVLAANILLVPLMLRYSKVLYLYGLGKLSYDPDALKK